jgi:hypothetical protein
MRLRPVQQNRVEKFEINLTEIGRLKAQNINFAAKFRLVNNGFV